MGDIADTVTGANTDLVERVLEEYGDPGQPVAAEAVSEGESESDGEPGSDRDANAEFDSDSESESNSEPEPEPESDSDPDTALPDLSTLTDTQLETLYAIADRPTATQAELAAQFDITSASISQRLSGIDGFDWADRAAFIEAVFDSDTSVVDENKKPEATEQAAADTASSPAKPDGGPERPATTLPAETEAEPTTDSDGRGSDGRDSDEHDSEDHRCSCHDQLETIAAQLDRLDQRLDSQPELEGLEPELVHKVAHACVTADHISTDEELRILRTLMGPRGA